MIEWLVGTLLRVVVRLLTGVRRLRASEVPSGPAVLFANHTSHFDTLILWAAADGELRQRLRPVAAADYWGAGGLRRWIADALLNALLIDRKPGPDADPIGDMEVALRQGACLILFPEGTRTPDGFLSVFKSGLYRVAERVPDAAFVPLYLENAGRALPKGEFIPIPILCGIYPGEPLRVAPGEGRDAFLQRARAAVSTLATGALELEADS